MNDLRGLRENALHTFLLHMLILEPNTPNPTVLQFHLIMEKQDILLI